jgi:hypothetical protein
VKNPGIGQLNQWLFRSFASPKCMQSAGLSMSGFVTSVGTAGVV